MRRNQPGPEWGAGVYRHRSRARFRKTGGVLGTKASAKMWDRLVLGPAASCVGPPCAPYSSPFPTTSTLFWVKPKEGMKALLGESPLKKPLLC